MIDCRHVQFNDKLAEQRIQQAVAILGEGVVRRLLCFSLYLLGVNRTRISEALGIAGGSVRTTVRAVQCDGLPALEDRRKAHSDFLPPETPGSVEFTVDRTETGVRIVGGSIELMIPADNGLQMRTVLLTLYHNGMISSRQVAEALNLSSEQVRNLAHNLQAGDMSALLPKRRGPKEPYVVSPDARDEIIQQFVLDIVTRRQTSGKALSRELEHRCQLHVPERTVRFHMAELGLSRIKQSLPHLLKTVKKTSADYDRNCT